MCQQQHGAGREHGQQHRQPETEGQGVQHEPGADRQLREEMNYKRGRGVAPSCHDPQQTPFTPMFFSGWTRRPGRKTYLKKTSKAVIDVNGGHIFGRVGKTRLNSTLEKREMESVRFHVCHGRMHVAPRGGDFTLEFWRLKQLHGRTFWNVAMQIP